MPLVNESDKDTPFVISNQNGKWVVNYPYPAETTQEFLKNIRQIDPLAVTFTGWDFAKGSFQYVYDRTFTERLRVEYYFHNNGADVKERLSLLNLIEENLGEFSPEGLDYIITLEKPLATLYEMKQTRLISDNPNHYYNLDKVTEFVDTVENEINNRRKREIPKEIEQYDNSEKFNIDDYKEKQSIQIAGQLVIFAENEKSDEPYMVCYCKWDNPLGINEYYNIVTTDDYIEALDLYAEGIKSFTQILKNERVEYDCSAQILTAADCIPNGLDENLEGKVIIIKPEVLSPEYRRSERQLKFTSGGFGCSPDALGTAVFCKDLHSGKESRFERYDVLGVADIEKLPEWARSKFIEYKKSLTPVQKQNKKIINKTTKKRTLQNKIDDAKEKAAKQNSERKNKVKKHGELEVD